MTLFIILEVWWEDVISTYILRDFRIRAYMHQVLKVVDPSERPRSGPGSHLTGDWLANFVIQQSQILEKEETSSLISRKSNPIMGK